jgi:hypothetical protein
LPVAELFAALKERADVALKKLKRPQSPLLVGQETPRDLAFDPKVPAPPPIKLRLGVDEFPDGIADRAAVAAILDLINQLPPLRIGETAVPLRVETLPPFSKSALAGYADDDGASEFRAEVRRAVALLKKHQAAFTDKFPRLPEKLQEKNKMIAAIAQKQMGLAEVYAELEAMYESLQMQKDEAAKEKNKNWQAFYHFVQARLQFRMAQFYEYNAMLGKIRKEDLPALNKEHKGYKLVGKIKMTDLDAEKIVKNARKHLEKIATDHPGTPWELIAKRERAAPMGLEWVADE